MQEKNTALDRTDDETLVSAKQRDAKGQLLPGHTLWRNHLPKTTRKGSRNLFPKAFVKALRDDYELHGATAIENCRISDTAAYLRLIASLLPKEIPKRPEEQMTDAELESELTRLMQRLVSR
ncbi:hypothetical protein [Methylocystis sp.]|uniref:hypothetical protein n=1 Tax=Methylocystis sp. TaxID=1911079 RepID=UPI003D0D2C2C